MLWSSAVPVESIVLGQIAYPLCGSFSYLQNGVK